MRATLLVMCLAAVGCAGSAAEQLGSATTDLALGVNSMFLMHKALCGTEERLATHECQEAASYYEFAACKFETVNAWLGGPAVSQACEP